MSVYLVAYSNPESPLPDALAETAESIIQLDDRPIWLVETKAENDELLEMIWPEGQEDESPTGPGIVVPVIAYSGYAQSRFWNWLKARIK